MSENVEPSVSNAEAEPVESAPSQVESKHKHKREEDSGEDARDPDLTPSSSKRVKVEKAAVSDDNGGYTFNIGGPGTKVTVSQWKGMTMVGVRKFYQDKNDGSWKPTKQGVSLTLENFKKLRSVLLSDEIDECISKLDG